MKKLFVLIFVAAFSAIKVSADTATTQITSFNLNLITGTDDLKGSALLLAGGGDQIIFKPSPTLSQALKKSSSDNLPTFAFKINPVPLGSGTFGNVTLTSVLGTNFGLTITDDGIEFSVTLTASGHVTPGAALTLTSQYVLPDGFDITIINATILVKTTLKGAGTAGGISFATPIVNAPFSVSDCTGVLINPLLSAPPPFGIFAPPVLPCDDIVTAFINANGGVAKAISDGLGTALVQNWAAIVSDIENGITSVENDPKFQKLFSKLFSNGNQWTIIQGTLFTRKTPCTAKIPAPCVEFKLARKTQSPPACVITPDTCDYGTTFACSGINTSFGDKLRVYGMAVGGPWTPLSTDDADANGNATVKIQAVPASGGPDKIEKFSVWNFDPQDPSNSAWDTDAQVQAVTLKGTWCHPSVCYAVEVCKLPNGTTFVASAKEPNSCAEKGGKFIKTTKCTKPS